MGRPDAVIEMIDRLIRLIPCLRAGQRPVLFELEEVRAALSKRAAERMEVANGHSEARCRT